MHQVNSSTDAGPKVILLVDPDTDRANATARALVESGYRTVRARSRAEAIDQAKRHPPDGILLGCGLPPEQSVDLFQPLRAQDVDAPTLIAVTDSIWSETVKPLDRGAYVFWHERVSLVPAADPPTDRS